MRRPAAHMLASAIVVSVDFPIPGAPPISTSDPGTTPPPSTESSSPMPVPSALVIDRLDVTQPDGHDRSAGARAPAAAARASSAATASHRGG